MQFHPRDHPTPRIAVAEIDNVGSSEMLVLIMLAPTGVLYATQAGGIACEQPWADGYTLFARPTGDGIDTMASCGRLDSFFHPRGSKGRRACDGGTRQRSTHKLARLATALDELEFVRDPRMEPTLVPGKMEFDATRIDQLVEAWVPVITTNGPAVLTWPNCD